MSLPAITPTTTQLPPYSPHSHKPNNTKYHHNQISIKPPLVDLTISYTSSIARHCRNNQFTLAVSEFTRMNIAGVEPNHITFLTLISACPNLGNLRFGASIHAYVRKLGDLDRGNVMVGTALIGMYSKMGRVDLARVVFDEMHDRNSVSWNAMIDGYMRSGRVESAIDVFDEMPVRDVISWTALIGGFVKKERFEEALCTFCEMQLSGVDPDYVTVISMLSACANMGTLGLGLWMHRYILAKKFGDNIKVSNSLIDMYSRCGCIEFAREIFINMPNRSLVSWNSIIVGFAINGHADEALDFFDLMQKEGFKPDGVSFTGALTACSHAGLVDKGLQFFDNMKKVHKIKPRIEHYGCVVDLYSRAGRLEHALNVIENMPMKPNEVVLGSLLAACRTHADLTLAERVMKCLVKLDPDIDSNYVLLSNIYAAVEKWDGANKVRKKMKSLGILKKPGFSSIEIDCCNHEFVAGDKSHDDTECIYAMLECLSCELRVSGYVPEMNVIELYQHD